MGNLDTEVDVKEPTGCGSVVQIAYEDLKRGSLGLLAKIEEAFGPSGLGIIAVSGVQGYKEKRHKLLPLAARLASMPDHLKRKLEDPGSSFNFGWSHGKEKLEGGRFDTLKGSFYANPMEASGLLDSDAQRKYPTFCHPNLWPSDDLPELEPAFQELGRLIADVGRSVTAVCDQYVSSKNPQFQRGRLMRVLQNPADFKGRLLFYFPPTSVEEGAQDISGWCGWHTDFGSLTGLTCAMFLKEGKEVPNPDPASGLYIENRQRRLVKANFPPDCIAFQMGQAMEIHSGGLLVATPHCVRAAQGVDALGVARSTFALFMQPHWDEPMDLPPGAGPMEQVIGQWEEGLTFGELAEKTNRALYETKS